MVGDINLILVERRNDKLFNNRLAIINIFLRLSTTSGGVVVFLLVGGGF